MCGNRTSYFTPVAEITQLEIAVKGSGTGSWDSTSTSRSEQREVRAVPMAPLSVRVRSDAPSFGEKGRVVPGASGARGPWLFSQSPGGSLPYSLHSLRARIPGTRVRA